MEIRDSFTGPLLVEETCSTSIDLERIVASRPAAALTKRDRRRIG